ncbi:MAG: hypothetical protein EBV06_08250 [Planctomycetia bacterium]|nr:hypothetical protein [Planctomycetia bacterium]
MFPGEQGLAGTVENGRELEVGRAAFHPVKSVANLESLAEGRTGWVRISSLWALEDSAITLDIGPDQAIRYIVGKGLSHARSGAIIERCPPAFVFARKLARVGHLITQWIGSALPRGRAQPYGW